MLLNKVQDCKNLKGKKVICRVDLNVPMRHGRVEDMTRILRLIPTLEYLIKQQAKLIIISHFGRPKGEFIRDMSLAPLADALSVALGGKEVKFAVDCVGEKAQEAIADIGNGDVLLLENLRFHAGEEANNSKFADDLAKLADIYVNDTFSCSHRKHASIVGVAKKLPSYAGLLMEEIESLEKYLENSDHPMAAIVGGSKVSSKLSLLKQLVGKVELLVIGGAMANTFLAAKGFNIGKSLYEPDLLESAAHIIEKAARAGCDIFLPSDVVVADQLKERAECKVLPSDKVRKNDMILDIGPESVFQLSEKLKSCKTVVWNGPIGAFEYRPFDVSSVSIARVVAAMTVQGKITSVAGGGDVVAALGISGLTNSFTYVSTAGGAFLQWLKDQGLPGIEVVSSKL